MTVQPGVLSQRACPGLSSRSRTRKRLNNHYLLILLLSLGRSLDGPGRGRSRHQSQQWPCVLAARGRQLDALRGSGRRPRRAPGHHQRPGGAGLGRRTVRQYGGEYLTLWIGFRSTTTPIPASAFSWVSGQPTTYTNWALPDQMILMNPRRRRCMSVSILWITPSTRACGTTGPTPGSLRVIPAGRTPAVWSRRRSWNPSLDSNLSPSSPTVNQPVSFVDTSTGAPSSRPWSFGDQGSSTDQNPGHTYSLRVASP